MAANGQVIFRQESEAEAGSNRIGIDASNWAAGVYYYTMEYRGQRITRKMNITRYSCKDARPCVSTKNGVASDPVLLLINENGIFFQFFFMICCIIYIFYIFLHPAFVL